MVLLTACFLMFMNSLELNLFCCCVSFFQDNYAVQSYEKAIAANNSGAFKWEIVPVMFWTFGLKLQDFVVFIFTTFMEVYKLAGQSPTRDYFHMRNFIVVLITGFSLCFFC